MSIREDLKALRVLRAFLKIRDPETRRRIVDFVEGHVPPSERSARIEHDPKDSV